MWMQAHGFTLLAEGNQHLNSGRAIILLQAPLLTRALVCSTVSVLSPIAFLEEQGH